MEVMGGEAPSFLQPSQCLTQAEEHLGSHAHVLDPPQSVQAPSLDESKAPLGKEKVDPVRPMAPGLSLDLRNPRRVHRERVREVLFHYVFEVGGEPPELHGLPGDPQAEKGEVSWATQTTAHRHIPPLIQEGEEEVGVSPDSLRGIGEHGLPPEEALTGTQSSDLPDEGVGEGFFEEVSGSGVPQAHPGSPNEFRIDGGFLSQTRGLGSPCPS